MVNTGYRQSVYWGDETKYGSATAIDEDLGVVQSVSPGERNNLIKVRTLGGNRDYKSVISGKFEISGSMDWYLQGGSFLRQCVGEDSGSTADADSGPRIFLAGPGTTYLHVLGSANSPTADNYPSFTLEFTDDEGIASGSTNLKRTYRGARVNSFTISGNVDEPVSCSADWMAMNVDVSTAAASSPTEYTTDPYVFYQGGVYLTSAVINGETKQSELSNDKVALCNSFEFTINNNCEAYWYISGTTDTTQSKRGPKFIIPKGRDTELRLGLHFESKEMYQRFLGNAAATGPATNIDKFQIGVDLLRSGVVGSAVDSNDDWLRLVVASASFDDIAINGAPEDIVSNDVTVFGKNFKIYIVDDVESYQSS
ncbi:hypothetical protein DRN69_06695 [Candidatus Pacearchaeota archaeon]|nr:MAG: hypothetical protein DRN69_06695 [Candidatus Pacearchaeota archaeon]